MEKKLFILFAVACTLCARGAWYWPFGSDEDSTNAPPRLHRLLEPANDYIELAQDASLNGDSEKAIENYRLALGELDRVEAEHPDRAESSEFAPLRLRRATCMAAIDAIRFAQVNENVRPVSVTDTTELQKRWEKLHGFADEEDEEKTPVQASSKEETKQAPPTTEKEEAKPVPPKKEEEAKPAPPPKEETKKTPLTEEKEEAKPVPPKKEEEEAKPAPPPKEEAKPTPPPEEKKPAPLPADWSGRIAQAMSDLRAQDYAAADVLLESMLHERPKDLNALLLRAAAQAGTKSYYAAQRTLERAMRAHPRSYLPYYNLANLLIQQNGDLEAAREYYELGRTVGGPVNKALETRLKGIGK